MKSRIFTLPSILRVCASAVLTMAACASVCLAAPAPAIVIYYSFDSPPASATLASMQAEVTKIFDPARLSVDWRQLDGHGGEVDSELVVARFRGACTTDGWKSP